MTAVAPGVTRLGAGVAVVLARGVTTGATAGALGVETTEGVVAGAAVVAVAVSLGDVVVTLGVVAALAVGVVATGAAAPPPASGSLYWLLDAEEPLPEEPEPPAPELPA